MAWSIRYTETDSNKAPAKWYEYAEDSVLLPKKCHYRITYTSRSEHAKMREISNREPFHLGRVKICKSEETSMSGLTRKYKKWGREQYQKWVYAPGTDLILLHNKTKADEDS